MVMPVADEDDQENEAWEGGFNFLRNILRAEIKALGINFSTLLIHATNKITDD